MRAIGVALLATASILLAACGGGGGGGGGPKAQPTPTPTPSPTPTPTPTPIVLGPNALGLLAVTNGGTSSSFLGYDSGGNGLSVDSTSYHLSLIVPSRLQWVVLRSHTSVSYAQSFVFWFVQDNRAFEVRDSGAGTFGTTGNVHFSEVNLTNNTIGTQFQMGTNLLVPDHVALIGNRLFYREAVISDLFGTSGGQLKVLSTIQGGGTTTTLLSRTHADNVATFNLGDNGTLYAVRHNTATARLTVHTRDQTTGLLATLLRDIPLADQAQYESFWSMKINGGMLYVMRKRLSDNTVEILTTDLTIVNTALGLTLLTTFTPLEGTFRVFSSVWGVDNGRIAVAHQVPGAAISAKYNRVTVFENGLKTTYDLGANTDVSRLAVIYSN
jgi:hypothetical protein